MPKAVIFGLSGAVLTPAENRFFKTQNPLGFILFARNAPDPVRLRALTDALRTLVGRDCPILIDQE
ncbi:MAG TPA: glycoside hydrolase, partial [Alphaproteobacteria bacterium]|nr:glycoside hydrolase [Alphaproteobacteria bacterium]